MTDIEKKALALVNEVRDEFGMKHRETPYGHEAFRALLRAIEQHEAFRQEVSDAVEALLAWPSIKSQGIIVDRLARFIIAKPDPLFEVVQAWWETGSTSIEETTDELREAIAKRGGKIVWEND